MVKWNSDGPFGSEDESRIGNPAGFPHAFDILGRYPVQPSTPLGPDQVNVIIIITLIATSLS
jgi:hypothetical protein